MKRRFRGVSVYRVGGLVTAGTTVLTASLIGVLALVTGSATGVLDRAPVYAVLTAASFVVSVVLQEEVGIGTGRTIPAAAAMAGASLMILGLSIEGLVYAITNPGQIVASRTLLYLLSAGMIGTGVGYWAFRNWHALRRGTRRGWGS